MARLLRALRSACAALGLLMILVTVTPVLRWWNTALSSPWGPDSGDVLVIPGSELLRSDTLGVHSYLRSFYGSLVWRNGHFSRVIVSGHNAAPLMADFLIGHGVPQDAIVVENRAESTRENAVEVARLLGPSPGRVIVLTSDYHAGRALRAFRNAGVTATALPYPDASQQISSWLTRWGVFLTLSEETVKTVWYRVRGW